MADVKINVKAETARAKSALDGLDKSMRGLSTGVKGVNTSTLNFNMALDAAQKVITGVKIAYNATAGAAVDYAAQVRDLNRVTGAGAEETSRLIQVADDMTISYQSLEQAAKIAAKNGIEFTTESLGRLSDQYLALNPGQERAAFLIETFGKNGLEMGKMMELGRPGIESMSAAVNKNLVATEAAVQAARDFETAQDDLGDAVMGVKIAIGNFLIPPLTQAANTTMKLVNWTSDLTNVFQQHEQDVRKTAKTYEEYALEIIRSGSEAKKYSTIQKTWVKGFLDGTIAVEGNKGALDELVTAVGGLSAAQYANKGIVEAQTGANQAWMDQLDDGRTIVSGVVESLNALDLSDVTSMFGELTKELIFNKAAAGMDAEAALELASGMGMIEPATRAAIERINELTQKYDTDGVAGISAAEAARGYTREVLAFSEAALESGSRDPYETLNQTADIAWDKIVLVNDELEKTPRNIPVTIDVTYNGQMPDQSWMDQLDNYGPSTPPAGSAANAGAAPANGSTYNITINTAASAEAVAGRIKILEAYGA